MGNECQFENTQINLVDIDLRGLNYYHLQLFKGDHKEEHLLNKNGQIELKIQNIIANFF